MSHVLGIFYGTWLDLETSGLHSTFTKSMVYSHAMAMLTCWCQVRVSKALPQILFKIS